MENQKRNQMNGKWKTAGKKLFTATLILTTLNSMAQNNKKFLSAKESEPSNFGWMQGFPPPADKTLHTWDGSFFEFPPFAGA